MQFPQEGSLQYADPWREPVLLLSCLIPSHEVTQNGLPGMIRWVHPSTSARVSPATPAKAPDGVKCNGEKSKNIILTALPVSLFTRM